MNNLSLIKKILVISLGLIIINVAMSIGVYVVLAKLQDKSEYLQGNVIQQALSSSRLKIATVQVQQFLTDVSATKNIEGFKEAEEWAKKFKEEINFLKNSTLDPETKNLVLEIDKSFVGYYQVGKDMANAYVKEGQEKGNQHMEKFDPYALKIVDQLEKLNNMVVNPIASKFTEITSYITFYEKVFLIVSLIVFLVSIVFVAINIKLISTSMSKIISNLSQSSQCVYQESDKLSGLAESLSQAATEESASVQETSSSIAEISSMIDIGAEHVSRATILTKESLDSAEHGKTIVEAMVKAIKSIEDANDEINRQTEETNKEISKVSAIIHELGLKTKVINDIVFQTKLLSFNASVEAARAGEQGKGFAVVAEEVGNLANSSGQAAHEITKMLDKSIETVNEIVESSKVKMTMILKESKKKLGEGTDIAKKCDSAFEEILRTTRDVTSMVNEIATASTEQAQGVREINKAIALLDQVTHQNAANASSVANTSAELNIQSDELNHLVINLNTIVNGQEKIKFAPAMTTSSDSFSFDNAIKAHSDWKNKLRAYISNPDGSLKEEVVCQDNLCPLGKWIYGEGAAHAHLAEYNYLRPSHAEFHQIAGGIVRQLNEKQAVDQREALGPNSEFAKVSKITIQNIMDLKMAINKR